LWRAVRESFPQFRFRRQHPIGSRIADLACPSRKLVIEVDGGHHTETSEVDTARTGEIEDHGYRVIRFWNNDVLGNTEAVLETIRIELLRDPPHPDPLRPEARRGR
jgi:very-short-patch-repair endonuclease